jgi:hypothetical protein
VLLGNSALLLVHLDHDARHGLCVLADLLDVLIGHRFRVLAKQFATRVIEISSGLGCACSTYSMNTPPNSLPDVRDAMECARSAPTRCRCVASTVGPGDAVRQLRPLPERLVTVKIEAMNQDPLKPQ